MSDLDDLLTILQAWLGRVQSVVGMKVTVNFENVGKVVINTVNIPLEIQD